MTKAAAGRELIEIGAGRRRSPDPVDRHVGMRLRQRRLALALTQADLAETLGLSVQQIRRIEQGSSRLAPRQLLLLARRLSVASDYLFDGAPHRERAAPALAEVGEIIASFRAIRDDVMRRDLFLLVQAAARRSLARSARNQT